MNKVIETIGKIVFYAFVVVVFLWTASLTLGEVKQILPADPLTPFFALALFDGGAVAWLLAWMSHARGLTQRAISLIMLIVDLAGVVLLSAARLFTGGQTLADAPEMIGAYVVWGIVGATLLNLAAVYAFHIADVDIMAAIETGLLIDTLRSEAQQQAKANIESQAQKLGAIMAARATGQLKYNLRLPMEADEARQVIDAQARDVDQKPASIKLPGIFARMMKRKEPAPAMVANMATAAAPGQLVNVNAPEVGGDVDPTNAPAA